MVSYAGRRHGVHADLEGDADDGGGAEHDRIHDLGRREFGVALAGGRGDDRLVGGDHDDELQGLGGDDVLSGGEGDDDLFADRRTDTDSPRTGRRGGSDRLSGGSGADFLVGNAGDNVLRGGSGFDTLLADPPFAVSGYDVRAPPRPPWKEDQASARA
ncbi:MAG: calcium-binding protein [Thermoleophilaceae bacterium]